MSADDNGSQSIENKGENIDEDPVETIFKKPAWLKGEACKVFARVLPELQKAGRIYIVDYYLYLNYCVLAGKQTNFFKK